MSQLVCAGVQERLPDFAAGLLDEDVEAMIRAHLGGCPECAGELAFVQVVLAGRPQAPEGFGDHLADAVARQTRRRRGTAHLQKPWWGLSAAAVAALAIGIGVASEGGSFRSTSLVEAEAEFREGELWLSDDGLLAGAPELDDLSDEALLELLEELSAEIGGGSGGTA